MICRLWRVSSQVRREVGTHSCSFLFLAPSFLPVCALLTVSQCPAGTITRLVQWLKYYKTAEGKGLNSLVSEIPSSASEAVQIIESCHARWQALKNGSSVEGSDFFLGRRKRW